MGFSGAHLRRLRWTFSPSISDVWAAAAIALLVFVVHLASPLRTSFDSRWTIHTAVSIAYRGDTDLDEYDSLLRPEYYAIESRGDHLYNRYPLGASLLALPLIAALGIAGNVDAAVDPEHLIRTGWAPVLEVAVASSLVAASAGLLFLVGRREGLGRAMAVVFALTFAFCTPAWSTASRGLWQHGPSILMLSATLYGLVLARERPGFAAAVALPLGFSLVVRPTNVISVGVFGCYVLLCHRRQFFWFAGILGSIVACFFMANYANHGSLLTAYYLPGGQPIGVWRDVPGVMAGHLVSPNRGLLIFSPVFGVALVACAIIATTGRASGLFWAAVLILLGHLLVISLFAQWWGGHSYGPRFWTDVLPLLMYLMIPALGLLETRRGTMRALAAFCFALLCGWSFFVHFRAATTWDVWEWNASPASVDAHPERNWDWDDLQILRGLGDSQRDANLQRGG
jgi:hypothetical protein